MCIEWVNFLFFPIIIGFESIFRPEPCSLIFSHGQNAGKPGSLENSFSFSKAFLEPGVYAYADSRSSSSSFGYINVTVHPPVSSGGPPSGPPSGENSSRNVSLKESCRINVILSVLSNLIVTGNLSSGGAAGGGKSNKKRSFVLVNLTSNECGRESKFDETDCLFSHATGKGQNLLLEHMCPKTSEKWKVQFEV